MTFKPATHAQFVDAMKAFALARPNEQGFLTWRTADQMSVEGMLTFLTDDGRAGYAIHPATHDIRNVFNYGTLGLGAVAVADALANRGGEIVDAFDTRLKQFYRDFGFLEVERVQWNDAYRPQVWNEVMYGRPDVVSFSHPLAGTMTADAFLMIYHENRATRKRSLRVASLFAGIGGMPLAATALGWEPVWFAEIDPYASAVLQKNFPSVPNHGDVRQIVGSQVGRVDILTGGFPCQDISLAGKGAGIEGERSGLWVEYARLIGELRPSYALIENVSILRSRGLNRVLSDLAALGYDAIWNCIPASHIGAPHQRDRIWIVAYSNAYGERLEGRIRASVQERACEWTPRQVYPPAESDTNTNGDGCAQWPQPNGGTQTGVETPFRDNALRLRDPDGAGGQWDVEPDVGRVANGIPSRMDRLKCLGNTIVPQEAHAIMSAIKLYEEETL